MYLALYVSRACAYWWARDIQVKCPQRCRLMTVMSTGTICDNHDLRKPKMESVESARTKLLLDHASEQLNKAVADINQKPD